tara:strand:- start:86 stop:736 length:651 start_codon:yes stop_codon:yes gene_type:complete
MLNIFRKFKEKKHNNRKSLAAGLTSRRIHQLLFYNEIVNKVKHLEGCFVECGVGWGRSALMIAELINLFDKDKKFYLFDTFTGFPELSEEDKEVNFIHKGYLNAPKEYVIKFFENSLLSDDAKIIFKEGDIKKTLISFDEDISLLHLDVDIHSSYDIALELLKSRVVNGGAIIIDEYNSKRFNNIKKVVDNHLVKNKYDFYNSGYKYFNRAYFIKK